jgi:putative endonuclease
MTANFEKRIRDHNLGHVFSTKGHRPWKLLYKEEMPDRADARCREKYLKHGVGKEFLKSLPL